MGSLLDPMSEQGFPSAAGAHAEAQEDRYIWLDSEEDWDACVIEVERSQESSSLSRKQWTAIQVKDLRKTMPEAKLNELVTRRKEAGLYYNDEDWPDDGEEKCARAFVRGGTWGTWGSRAETGQSHTKTRWC